MIKTIPTFSLGLAHKGVCIWLAVNNIPLPVMACLVVHPDTVLPTSIWRSTGPGCDGDLLVICPVPALKALLHSAARGEEGTGAIVTDQPNPHIFMVVLQAVIICAVKVKYWWQVLPA